MPEPIRAPTYRALIDAVVKFRADNVIPIGDVRAEIDEYICKNFPRMCHQFEGVARIEVAHSVSPIRTLTDEMIQTMDRQIQDHSTENLELKQEAQRRADVCAGCRFNVRWNSNCGSCVEAVNRMSAILRAGQTVHHERELRACQILRHENRSAVWLRMDKIGTSPDLPGYCWARR
jgi:hypothetical protein